jgi:hypothetical protein
MQFILNCSLEREIEIENERNDQNFINEVMHQILQRIC